MNFLQLVDEAVDKNNSLVCIGLDPSVDNMPAGLNTADKIFEFNRQIIDATADLVCAYKPNTAFYEAFGAEGIKQLKQTCDYIKQKGLPLIIDAKRADIGSTNEGYVKFVFDYLGGDAVTLNPYLGGEALKPFFNYTDKGLIILCRTSNPGSGELQDLEVAGQKLFEIVAEKVSNEWNESNNCLLVVGATYPEELAALRNSFRDMTFLVPGIGAQGGDLIATLKAGLNLKGDGLIINAGRSIIYALNGKDFADAARREAEKLRNEINKQRSQK